jgi:hypothetical protein
MFMKAAAIGVATFIIAMGLYFWGFNVGMGFEQLSERAQRNPQMQCIQWVEQWKSAPTTDNPQGAPTFAMFTALCGKPDSK